MEKSEKIMTVAAIVFALLTWFLAIYVSHLLDEIDQLNAENEQREAEAQHMETTIQSYSGQIEVLNRLAETLMKDQY